MPMTITVGDEEHERGGEPCPHCGQPMGMADGGEVPGDEDKETAYMDSPPLKTSFADALRKQVRR